MSGALLDLYRDIVANINDPRDLFPLSITSRALGYEAERCLYRKLKFELRTRQPFSVTHFLLLGRIAHHVRDLHFSGISQNDYSILPALQSVPNLEHLNLEFITSLPLLDYCPSDPPFQLHQLSITNIRALGFKKFAQTQRRLTTLMWYPRSLINSNIPFSQSNLPALISLLSPLVPCIFPLLPQICHLKCDSGFSYLQDLKGKTFGSLTALEVPCLAQLDLYASIFPNTKFLAGMLFKEFNLRGIEQFAHLKKLRIQSAAHPDDINMAYLFGSLPSLLFDRHNSLDTIEIWGVSPSRCRTFVFQRGGSEPVISESIRRDEWLSW